MKLLTTFFKCYFIIFSFLSILSTIDAFESLPLWKNNKKSTPLPEDLSNSEIISFSSDNSTNTILYLINENDNSFLYINGSKYENIFKEELTYLTPPLIENNGNYYFCSSSKNIIKLDSNGTLEKIDNPNNLDNYTDYNLKCFYRKKENVIIVTFINTPFVSTYDLTESIWKKNNNNEEYQLKLGDLIFDANIDNTNTHNFIVLYKEQSSYIVQFYQYNNFQFNGIYYLSFEDNFYSKTMCSFGIKNQQIFVFTYEPYKLNNFNFYQLDLGQARCVNNQGNIYLRIFRDAEIYDAYFLENSPLLFYNIRKIDIDGEYIYYIGVIDIESLVVLYNIKLDKYKKVFYDFGFLYQNKGFLKCFEGGNEIEICPFIYNVSNNDCQLYINNINQYFSFNDISGEYENIITDNCINKGIINKFCLEQCPIGFELQNNNCIKCQENSYYNYGTKKCTNNPNNQYKKEGQIVYDCKDANLTYFNYNCYNNCSEIYGIIDPDNDYECVTCKSLNKIYFNNECVDNCTKGYEIKDIEMRNYQISFCQNCLELKKYYYNQKCYDECPSKRQLYNSSNICYFCHEIGNEKYYQNGKCVSKCEKGYESINNNNEYYCNYCKDDGHFFTHNNKCENSCEEYSLYYEDNNTCYFCNETNFKYYQNGSCVEKCDRGYETNEEQEICEFCHDKKPSMYYFNGTCINQCPEFLAWNESDNICVDCKKELNNYFRLNKCVSDCGKMKLENDRCIPCSGDTKYFFQYNCFERCPNYTIETITDDDENYCRVCDGKYQDGECVNECKQRYVENITKVEGIEIKLCSKCGTNNKSWYEGNKCVLECSSSKYASDDHYCRLCFCGFSKNYTCDPYSDKCFCDKVDEGEKFGSNCEFFSKIKLSEKKLKIIPIDPIISSKKSIFSYELTDNTLKNKIINLKWEVFIDNTIVNDLKYFPSGINEDKFVINSGLLTPENNNKVVLEININDTNNIIYLKDEIEIKIQLLSEENNAISLISDDSINKVMNNIFTFKYESNEDRPIRYYYKILIKDEYNEIIPIKQKKELITLTEQSKDESHLNFTFPILKEFIFELSSNREEKKNYNIHIYDNSNTNINYSIEDIINKNLMDDYSEIEKIFLIMKYLDLNKNENISDSNYELLLKFIKNKIYLLGEKGYYEDKDIIDSKRYYTNYYEPKTIFSLLNKIFLHQKTKIPNTYFKSFINLFNIFFDGLTEKRNPGKYIEKIPNSDILSFFRTFDHLLYIYSQKESIEGQDKINNTIISNIFDKMSEYLITELHPGETIRLVGKKISFFLSNFGKYQNHLSFSSVDNISDTLKYEDYNTFSFDDYNINQETCDDDGNTLLCIQSKKYKDFKELKLDIINIESFVLSVYKFNKLNKNESDSVELKLINIYEINHLYKINGIFYDVEFSLNDMIINDNIILSSNLDNEEEKDYTNITCIPKNNLLNKDIHCFTYFNYEKNIIKCSCNVFDEITYVCNSTLADFYKDIQINTIQYDFKNKASLILIFIILLIIIIPNCIYLFYDIRKEDNNVDNTELSLSEKIRQKYLNIKILCNSSIFSFAFYAFLFKFPYLSPLRTCDYKSPKYIKHFIISLGIFYGFIISLLPFYFFVPFEERVKFFNRRDIKNQDFEIEKNIFFRYFHWGILFSICGVFITRIFIYIFGIILSYNEDEINYWSEMKTIFTNYIFNEIKGNVLLGPTWIKIRTRMVAYINICGDYILKKTPKKNNNFENYLNSRRSTQSLNITISDQLLPTFNLDDTINLDLPSEINSGDYKAPSIDTNNSNKVKSHVISIKDPDSKSNTNSYSDNNNFIKVINTDNFQLYSKNIKMDKTIKKNDKYERIKNKYICPSRKSKSLLESEIEPIIENKPLIREHCAQLVIEHEYNYSFFPIKEYIKNDALSTYSNKSLISSKTNKKYVPEGYSLLINVNIALSILLFLLVIIIFVLIKSFLNNFGFFIIKVWLHSTITIYIIIYPLFYYLKNLAGSVLLFKCYHLRSRTIYYRAFFWIFTNKSLTYMFKVRNYITKYKNELDY